MRHQVAQWMLEVAEAEALTPSSYPQAMQMLDRFLSAQSIPTTQLQLLAATCLLIASKGESMAPKIFFENRLLRKFVSSNEFLTTSIFDEKYQYGIKCSFDCI